MVHQTGLARARDTAAAAGQIGATDGTMAAAARAITAVVMVRVIMEAAEAAATTAEGQGASMMTEMVVLVADMKVRGMSV